jgi:hypothetical protein
MSRYIYFSEEYYGSEGVLGCVRARSLSTAAQIKKKGEPLLVFTGLWFGICAIIF